VAIVDVWFADPRVVPAAAKSAAQPGFSVAERSRYEGLRRERDRALYLAAHLNVRAALAAATRTGTREWRIDYDAKGRPLAIGPSGVVAPSVSITHTTGLAACAIGDAAAVGIDVEACDRKVNAAAIARRRFSEREHARLLVVPGPERDRLFLEYWTLKEAYLKGRGIGVRVPLKDVDLDLSESGEAQVRTGASLAREDGWRLSLLRAPQGYVAALAARPVPPADVEIRLHEATAADLLGHDGL
jgi:4'-phosphopantetheinyl transferase